ncbi:hypothetical protein [Xenorhabdus hominickii]|uniref:Uncharacterized protein n=1 Tax=Xenorhabdus hominickii TaxID=351679 RepID=A0A2G0QG60_XENHO|nr:hypothetical protein [Xenorhabdus hominickii]AOM42223.1 hypothetical protein A9255_17670 [Xenorhabdus hominickii]PHM58223.1 hypothetical protein Xhom_01236 [Xenorhabdus hominickii]
MLNSLNTSILLERIELICKMGGSEYLNDNDRQIALFWLGELIKQVKSELETQIEKPLNSGSTLKLCGTGLQ